MRTYKTGSLIAAGFLFTTSSITLTLPLSSWAEEEVESAPEATPPPAEPSTSEPVVSPPADQPVEPVQAETAAPEVTPAPAEPTTPATENYSEQQANAPTEPQENNKEESEIPPEGVELKPVQAEQTQPETAAPPSDTEEFPAARLVEEPPNFNVDREQRILEALESKKPPAYRGNKKRAKKNVYPKKAMVLDYDPKEPSYKRAPKPNWGFQMTVTNNAFADTTVTKDDGTVESPDVWGLTGQFEYQPDFLQFFGALSVGLGFSLYPVRDQGVYTTSNVATWAGSAQVRYQLRVIDQQWVVPAIAYTVEYFRYSMAGTNEGFSSQEGGLIVHGPTAGAWLYLNWLDQASASSFYVDYSVSRSYLVFEARLTQGSNSIFNLSGLSYFGGFRVEY